MDYDEDEFQAQNYHVSGEGSSKFSPVLHPYALPKFDFDDGLQGHLRFDNLVENESFLGLQSQEDNQWIEDYSRGSGVFSSSAPEPCPIIRSSNVWSEATSSESVEMLLNSVGQEETTPIAGESDACKNLGSVAEQMDSHFEDDKKLDVMDSEPTLVSEKVADHSSVLSDFEGVSNSPRVEITTDVKSLSPNNTSGSYGVHGIDYNLGSQSAEGNVSEVDASLTKFPVNQRQDPSDSNMNTEDGGTMSHLITVNTIGSDNQESVTNVTNVGSHSANCLLADSIKEVKKHDIESKVVTVDDQVLKGNTSETVGENSKNLSCSSPNPEIVELLPVEINTGELDKPPGFAVVESGHLHIAEECDGNVELSKGSGSDHVDSSDQTRIHQQLDEHIQDDSPKDFQHDAAHVVVTEKVEISVRSELKTSKITEVSNNLEEKQVLIHASDCQLGLGGVPALPILNSEVSNAQGDRNGMSFAEEDSAVTSICCSTAIQEKEHSIEKSEVINDALGIHKGPSAEDRDSPPTVSVLATFPSDPNRVHNDPVVSSNEEVEPVFPNNSGEMERNIVGFLEHQKTAEVAFNQDRNKKDEAVGGSESDAATSVTAETPSLLYEIGARVDLAAWQMGGNLKNEQASSVVTNPTPLKDTSQSTYEMHPVLEIEKSTVPNYMTELSKEGDDHSLQVNETFRAGSGIEQAGVFVNVTAGQSSTVTDSSNAGIQARRAEKNNQISESSSSKLELFPGTHEQITEQKNDADASDVPVNNEATGKEYRLAPSKVSGSDVSMPTTTVDKSKDEKEQKFEKSLVKDAPPIGSVESAAKEVQQSDVGNDRSFTFNVDLSSGVAGEHGEDKQSGLTTQSSKSYKEVSPSTPTIGPMMKTATVLEISRSTSPALDLEIAHGGLMGTPVCKRGRSSGKAPAKQSAKKRNSLKETTLTHSGSGDNRSSVSTSLSGTGQLQFEAVKFHEKLQQSSTVYYAGVPVATPNLPDLNSSALPSALVRHHFTDIQQMQLRAQIFVYGSLIQGAAPDETCMVAAFGTSDGGRSTWDPVWRACVEKLQGAKSNLSKSENIMQPQSGLCPPEQTSTKKDAPQSSLLLSPVGRTSSKGTPSPVVHSMIPLSSPLWNASTPFHGLQSTGLPRSSVFDYRQTLSSYPFQTPPSKNVTGNSSSWPLQASFPAPWFNASQTSPFDGGVRLPTTETVKVTPNKEPVPPVASGATQSFPNITVQHSDPGVSPETYTLPDVKKLTMPSGHKTAAELKTRKRKKSTAVDNVNQIISPAQARIETIPVSGSLFAPAQTEFLHGHAPAPVIPSHISTSVVVSTPPFFGSKGNDSRKVSIASPPPSYMADQPKIVEPNTVQKSNLPDIALNKADEGKQQTLDVNTTTMSSGQKKAEPKSRRRKKSTTSENVNQISFPAQAQIGSAPLSLFAAARTNLLPSPVSAHVIPSHYSTSVVVSTPLFGSKENNATIGAPLSSSYLSDQPKRLEPNTEQKSNLPVDVLNKAEEAKQQAEDAAALAADAVSHSQTTWDQLNRQKNFGFIPEVEAKLTSAAIAVAAAAAVAKAAAAAAQVASNAASQAKIMADEAWISGTVNYPAFNTAPFVSYVGNSIGLATTPSVLKIGDDDNFSSSILVAAKEATKKKVEAASFASKRAENLDAIINAAELAAAAVSQAGRIVAMGDPPSLAKLVEAGPEGYWRAPQIAPEHPNAECSNVDSIQATPNNAGRHVDDGPLKKKAKTASRGMSTLSKEVFNESMNGVPNLFASSEKDSRAQKDFIASNLNKPIGIVPESEIGSQPTSITTAQYDNIMGTEALKGTSIREGSLVEVKKEGNGFKEVWFSANVLSVENGKAFVSYAASRSGLTQLKEWVSLESDNNNAPRIRVPPPVMDVQYEGTRKRGRGAIKDHAWSVGDKVDVWIKECWREGVVIDKNKLDATTITVHFPAEGETSVVRAWQLRPTLIWKVGRWIENSSSRQKDPSHEGDTPLGKRVKLGGPSIEGSKNDNVPKTFQHTALERPEELQLLPLSEKEKSFNLGENIKKENKLDAPRIKRSGLQKEGPRVVFGVPKPGKKKKFMEVSKHYVTDSSNKPGKPMSSFDRTLSQKDKLPKSALSTKSKAKKAASTDGSESEQEKQSKFETASSRDGATQGSSVFSSSALSRNMFTSNARPERVKGTYRAPIASKSTREVKGSSDAVKQIPEIAEPRRSNRRIQPTSRLLEGLQSSLVLPKFPSFGLDKGQRSHSRSTPKGKQ